MRLTQSILPALALALAWGVPAQAQAPEPSAAHLAAGRELVVASGASSSIDRIIPSILDEIRQQTVTRPELKKDMEEVFKALQGEMDAQRQQAYTVAARAYAKFMSEAEIREVAAFFKSPTGSKYIRVQPDLTDDLVNAISIWSQTAGEYILTRTRAEMGKRGQQMQ